MRYLELALLITLIACSSEQKNTMDRFQHQETVTVTLDELQVNEIPNQIGELTHVTHLTIQQTQPESKWSVYPPLSWYETRERKEPFHKLPESIGRLRKLKSLQLSNLDIHELPESIAQLDQLEFLDLSMNKLDLSNELGKLKRLSRLRHLRILGNHFNENEMNAFKKQHPKLKVEYKDETESNSR